MDIGYLTKYAVPLIVGICLCVGYIIKNMIPSDKINRFIPLIMGILGVVLNVWVNMDFTAEILLAGLFSGLSSTGLYELFRNLIGGNSNGLQRYKWAYTVSTEGVQAVYGDLQGGGAGYIHNRDVPLAKTAERTMGAGQK